MAKDYKPEAVKNSALLANFFSISDIHITDEESPAQALIMVISGISFLVTLQRCFIPPICWMQQ